MSVAGPKLNFLFVDAPDQTAASLALSATLQVGEIITGVVEISHEIAGFVGLGPNQITRA